MTRKELNRLKEFLEKCGPKENAYRDECLAYVNKDLAIRDQQAKAMHDLNRPDVEYPW